MPIETISEIIRDRVHLLVGVAVELWVTDASQHFCKDLARINRVFDVADFRRRFVAVFPRFSIVLFCLD